MPTSNSRPTPVPLPPTTGTVSRSGRGSRRLSAHRVFLLSGIKSHEFNDTPITLQKKVHVLAQLIRQSKCPIAYTGAGISTAAGIDDYATKAKEESVTLR